MCADPAEVLRKRGIVSQLFADARWQLDPGVHSQSPNSLPAGKYVHSWESPFVQRKTRRLGDHLAVPSRRVVLVFGYLTSASVEFSGRWARPEV